MKTRKKPKIKAIVFDMGNVILNFNARKAAKRFSKACKVPLWRVWVHFFTDPTEKAYTRGEITSYAFFRHAKSALKTNVSYKTFKHYWNDIFWPNPGMDALLRKLKKNYPLYLISNTNALHYAHIRKKFKVLKHFRRKFPSHQVGHRKPDPKIYKKVLKKIGYRAKDTVFIDDVQKFVTGAENVGMNAIRFHNPKQLTKELRKLGVMLSLLLLLPLSVVAAITGVTLEGVSYDDRNPSASIAVINGDVYQQGDSVQGYVITEIHRTRISLKGADGAMHSVMLFDPNAKPKLPANPNVGRDGKPVTKEAKGNFFQDAFSSVESMMGSFGGPFGEYKKFGTSVFKGKFRDAETYLHGSSAKSQLNSINSFYEPCRLRDGDRYAGGSFKLKEQKKNDDGSVNLVVSQIAKGDPPGVTSAFGAAAVIFDHKATMVKVEGGWKIKSFSFKARADQDYGYPWMCFR